MSVLATLGEPEALTRERAGGKAATLAALTAAGIAVPAGFTVGADVLDAVLDASGARQHLNRLLDRWPDLGPARELTLALDSARIPAAHWRDITAAYRELSDAAGCPAPGWLTVAVRSSGIAEDGSEDSFAGVHDSVLDVHDLDSLQRALTTCWQSQWSPAALSYRVRSGREPDFGMGVLVQRQVPASAAGVLFTADPVSAARSMLIVEAVRGRSESLMAGEAEGDAVVIDRITGSVRVDRCGGDEPVLSERQLADLQAAADAIEADLGPAQDIEFVFEDERLWVVQARPITGVSRAPGPNDGRFWQVATELFPHPLTRWAHIMFDSFVIGLNRARRGWHSPCTLQVATVDNWLYLAEDVDASITEPARRAAYEAEMADRVVSTPQRWRQVWRPELLSRGLAELNADVHALDDEQLLARLQGWVQSRADAETIGVEVGMVAVFVLARLSALGPDLARDIAQAVLGGLPSMLDALESAVWELAHGLAEDPRLKRSLQQDPPAEVLTTLRQDRRGWELFQGLLAEHGYNGVDGIESLPWAEDPTPLLISLRDKLEPEAQSPAVRRQRFETNRQDSLDALIAARPEHAELIRKHAAELAACMPLGQDRFMVLTELGHAVTRHYLNELGARLGRKGLLNEPMDTLHLDLPELSRALLADWDPREAVLERQRQVAASAGRKPVPEFGPEQNLEHLPFVIDSILSPRGDALLEDHQVDEVGTFVRRGVPGAPGYAEGRAVVCRSLADAAALKRGDVLVCVSTTPAWTQYYGIISAVVTDKGGLLSHPAVVAREYGIPAVLGLAGGTSWIHNGETVAVDGDHGSVRRLADATS